MAGRPVSPSSEKETNVGGAVNLAERDGRVVKRVPNNPPNERKQHQPGGIIRKREEFCVTLPFASVFMVVNVRDVRERIDAESFPTDRRGSICPTIDDVAELSSIITWLRDDEGVSGVQRHIGNGKAFSSTIPSLRSICCICDS